MTLAKTTATNDRYRDYNPSPLRQENSFELPKLDEGVSALLDYEILLEDVHEEDSDEVAEIIHDSDFLDLRLYQPSKWLFANISWEAWKEPLPFRKKEDSPTTHVVEEIYKNIILGEMFARLYTIAQREDNWDGLDSMKPNESSLDRAGRIMAKLLDSIFTNGEEWIDPFISSDEDGYVTVEWQGDGRRLCLLIEEEEVEYTKLWRINTKRKVRTYSMRDDDCFEIWEWLING